MDTANVGQVVENVAESPFLNPIYTALIGIFIVAALFELWVRNTREYRFLKNIPTLPTIPVLGNAHHFLKLSNSEILSIATNFQKQLGNVIWARLGPVHIVFLIDPLDVELIMGNSVHNEKATEYRYFVPWFGKGLLVSKGQHWSHHRKMIAPTFHQTILKSFMPKFNQYSKGVIKRFENLEGIAFDCHHHMSEVTVEVLLSTVMCVKDVPDRSKCGEYAKAVMGKCDLIHKRQFKLWYRYDPIYNLTSLKSRDDGFMKTILAFTKKVVNERRKDFNAETDVIFDEGEVVKQRVQVEPLRKEAWRDEMDILDESDIGAKRRLPLLDAMVDMTRNPDVEWTEKDIIDEVNTLMFEGHDTTASGTAFVLCMLGIHKDIQRRAFEEQKQLFGTDLQRDCTFNDTTEMHYLDRVIKETLRLYPPVPMIARKIGEDVKLKSGNYTIPHGTTVVMPQFSIHRSPEIYKNPLEFNPDNFLPENVSKRHYYSYVPFAAGPRSCVGRKFATLMMKVLLSHIIRNYEIDSGFERPEDLKLQADIILKIENGSLNKLHKRI